MYIHREDNRILLAFLTVSLLIHLLLIFLMPELNLLPEPETAEPVYVEVRTSDINLSAPLKKIEIDSEEVRTESSNKEAPPITKDIVRIGESNQIVPKEIAPKGDAVEDHAPLSTQEPQETEPVTEMKTSDSGDRTQQIPTNLNISKLLDLPQSTINRLSEEWRFKYRREVEEGNAIWLNSTEVKYFSLLHRLRIALNYVWEFPIKSIEKREEGTCLLMMTFNRDGSINKVELLESSGFPRLDRAAIAAIYKGAPYGKLPKDHKKETLSILGSFSYSLYKGSSVY